MKSVILPLHNKLKSRELSVREVVDAYISAIESENTKLNAYVCKTFDEAKRNADVAQKLIDEKKAGYLTGIPMTLKDNIATDGLNTTCCSKILQNFKPYYDATVWEKLKSLGGVLLGKTNMDEFAMGSTSETSIFGAPKNPRDLSRVTGGSSGGGASAVCAHIAGYALGSDTGGSIRQPASYCGVVGFKPTYGAVSRYGLIAYGSSLDQIGPITSSVTDSAIVYDAIKGEDKRDMTSHPVASGETKLTGDVKGVKVGIVKEFFEGLNPEIKTAIDSQISHIQRDGGIVEEVSIPTIKTALPVYYIIACAEASSNLGRYDGIRYGFRAKEYSSVDDMVIKTRTQGFGREVQKRIMLGTYVLSSGYFDAYYKKACVLRERIKGDMEKVFSKYDFLIAPTAPNCAYPAGYTQNNPIEMYLSDICTVPANICGLPAISIPCGKNRENLPIGMQIIGNKFRDGELLSFAYYFEKEGLCDLDEVKGGVQL